MPRYEDPDYGEYYVHIPDSEGREELGHLLWGSDGDQYVDSHAMDLFHDAFFEKNESAYQELIDYLWDEYGFDFEDAFEWEDFREWAERTTGG